jgi:hypothetical protein
MHTHHSPPFHTAASAVPHHTSNSVNAFLSEVDSPGYSKWNADTGASCHMTPHLHWIRNLVPHRMEIKLADGSSVFSRGKGSVLFEPVFNGETLQQVEFTNVLYVPDLRNNLISVLYLSLHKGFSIQIEDDLMEFRRGDSTLFTATINSSITAYLQGTTIPITQSANLSSSTIIPIPQISSRANTPCY